MPEERIPAEKAKQGRKGTRVFWILAISLVLALIAWGAVEVYGRMSADPGSAPPVTQSQP